MEPTNFRGLYRQYDTKGYIVKYNIGDVVEYNGKQYIATGTNFKDIPDKNNSNWKLYSGNTNGFYYSETEPLDANIGDRWVDKTTGKMYTYIEDNNGFNWVEF